MSTSPEARPDVDSKKVICHEIPKDEFINAYSTGPTGTVRNQNSLNLLRPVQKMKGKPGTIEHLDRGSGYHYVIYYDTDGTGQGFISWKDLGDEIMHIGIAMHLRGGGVGLQLAEAAYANGCRYAPLNSISSEQAGLYHKLMVRQAAKDGTYIETDVLKDYPDAIDLMPEEDKEEARDRLIDIGVLPPKDDPKEETVEGGGGVVIRSEESDELL